MIDTDDSGTNLRRYVGKIFSAVPGRRPGGCSNPKALLSGQAPLDPWFYLLLLVLVLSAISASIVGYLLYEKHQWKKFVKEHDCVLVENRPVARRAGGMGRRMRGTSAWFQRKVYQCDDGKTYQSLW